MDDALDVTHRVEASHFWFRGFRRFITPILNRSAGGGRQLRLLDCGCGTGHNLHLLSRYGLAVGFDLTASGLAHARVAGAPVARADVSHIPFRTATFDLVTCFDVMQYAVDDQATLVEIARVLKPGGRLVLTASAMAILSGGHAAFWPELRRYDRERMRRIALGAGLQVERVTYLFASLFPMMLATRLLSRVRPPATEAQDDWEMQVPPAPINALLTSLLRVEARLMPVVSMPFGSSVLLVARKP